MNLFYGVMKETVPLFYKTELATYATITWLCYSGKGIVMSNLNLFSQEKRKTAGRRNDKIASQIRECFAMALARADFPILPNHEDESKLKVPVTLTYVDMSPDLRNATIFFTPLGGLHKQECLKFFELQTHYFKDVIAKKMKMRFIPNIFFKLDDSFEYSQKIEGLLKKN